MTEKNTQVVNLTFIKKPKKTNIIKVYYGTKSARYGEVIDHGKDIYYSKNETKLIIQETVILNEIKETKENNIDFFLDCEKIEWNSIIDVELVSEI
jgi:hypothetical protein